MVYLIGIRSSSGGAEFGSLFDASNPVGSETGGDIASGFRDEPRRFLFRSRSRSPAKPGQVLGTS